MATNAIHGRFGAFYVDQNATPTTTAQRGVSYLGNISSWSLSGERPTVDTTTLGDTNETSVSGLPAANGQLDGVLSVASTSIFTVSDGLERAFYRYNDDTSSTTRQPIANGGKGYDYGIATFNGVDVKSGVKDATTFSMKWSLVGNLAHV